jgi:thymidylate synthase (FAD)
MWLSNSNTQMYKMTSSIETPKEIETACGFVRLVDILPKEYKSESLKCDEAIVQAARVSYDGESKGDKADINLVKYLIKHNHGTPLESIIFKFHIKCPIFVQRHIVKHRMTSMNEISARYVKVEDSWYTPTKFRMQSDLRNKQASGSELDEEQNAVAIELYNKAIQETYNTYETLLDRGVSRELARSVLPQAMYTQFYLTLNLRSLMNLVYLRNSPDAQWETQQIAAAMEEIWSQVAPVSYETFRGTI